jgi:hypothetical protein
VPANFRGVRAGPAGVDPNVAADHPAQWRQLLQERPDPRLILRIVRGGVQQDADPPHPRGLRARGERPRRRRAAQERDEIAPLHGSSKLRRQHLIGPKENSDRAEIDFNLPQRKAKILGGVCMNASK